MDDASKRWRKVASGFRKLCRFLLEDRTHGVCSRIPLKRSFSGDHLVKDRAQAEEVGATVHDLSAYLLRRHVAQRPKHQPRMCEVDRWHRTLRPTGIGANQLGQPEIKDLYYAIARCRQPARSLQGEVDRISHWDLALFQPLT